MKRLLHYYGHCGAREERFKYTLDLANRLRAEITCLYDLGRPTLPDPTAAPVVSEADIAKILHGPQTRLADARREYDALTLESGISSTWVDADCAPLVLIDEHAIYADWVVVEQPSIGGLTDGDVFHLVGSCPGGILTLPAPDAPNLQDSTVVIGWNASRSSVRAVHESLPLLQLAKEVFIATIDDTLLPSDEASHAAKLADYLASYEIATQHIDGEAGPERVGSTLLSITHDVNADLLVMGAFGRSRAFEYWFGGATRDVLTAATIPVFLAH